MPAAACTTSAPGSKSPLGRGGGATHHALGVLPVFPVVSVRLCACLRRFADATSDFGTLDNEEWAEYAPTCVVWDGVPFGVAEPLNAISALAYDELVCVANLSFAHTALQLVKDRECPLGCMCLRSGSTPPLRGGAPNSIA